MLAPYSFALLLQVLIRGGWQIPARTNTRRARAV